MVIAHRATRSGRRYSLANKAKALAVILREEFDVAFVSYDALTGVRIGSSETQQCNDTWVALEASTVTELAAAGRAHVTLLPYNRYELAIPLHEGGKVILVAVAAIAALVPPGSHAAQEQLRLQRWAQSVCDRLRGSDQLLRQRRSEEEQKAQVKMAWEVILTLDHLIRHLRIHKNPAKNQDRILEGAFELLGVQSLLWVPQHHDAPVTIQGESFLAPSDCRQLASCIARLPERDETGLILCNEVQSKSWGTRFPNLSNLLAFAVTHQSHIIGWVIALNRVEGVAAGESARTEACNGSKDFERSSSALQERSQFRRSDAALLSPFVALLGLHARG